MLAILRIFPWGWPDCVANKEHRTPARRDFDKLPRAMKEMSLLQPAWTTKYGRSPFGRLIFRNQTISSQVKGQNVSVRDLVWEVEDRSGSVGGHLHNYYSRFEVDEVKTKRYDIYPGDASEWLDLTHRQVHTDLHNSMVDLQSGSTLSTRLEVTIYLKDPRSDGHNPVYNQVHKTLLGNSKVKKGQHEGRVGLATPRSSHLHTCKKPVPP